MLGPENSIKMKGEKSVVRHWPSASDGRLGLGLAGGLIQPAIVQLYTQEAMGVFSRKWGSREATPNGPVIWKNRDTGAQAPL